MAPPSLPPTTWNPNTVSPTELGVTHQSLKADEQWHSPKCPMCPQVLARGANSGLLFIVRGLVKVSSFVFLKVTCVFCACLLGLGRDGRLVEYPLVWPEMGPQEPLPGLSLRGQDPACPGLCSSWAWRLGSASLEPWRPGARPGPPCSLPGSPLGQQGLDVSSNPSVLERKGHQPHGGVERADD